MDSISYLSPAMLWGMALAAIPIIIHLLFRRRFRRIEWAPMHYLKLSIQRNRRRVRLEQLLLLILRTALVLLLFFLVARPVIHAAGLGGWLGGRSRSSQLILLDNSLSMGYRDGGRSAWEQAQALAVKLLETVGPKDRFTLVLASQPKTPLLREVELTNPEETAQLIARQQPAETFTAWAPVFEAVDELLDSGSYPIRELTVITDLRRPGWEDSLAELGGRWAAQQLQMRVFNVGSERTGNVSTEDLKQLDRLALAGQPVQFEAVVRNATDRELADLDASFSIDGKPSVVRLPAIAPGETAKIPLVAAFQEPGLHHVEFELPQDELPGDNRRYAACRVREEANLLLVDGEPSSDPLGGEVDFLGLALALGVGEADAFRVQIATDAEWAAAGSGDPDLVVLANVASLAPEQAERLKRQVEAGAGLMIFVGDQIDPANYNQLLADLLPAPLEAAVDEDVSGLLFEPGAPGPLDALAQLNAAVMARIKLRRFYQVQLAEDAPGVRVLACWNSASAAPAVLERTVGAGRVLLWTTTADKNWTDWPTEPSYVLTVREAAKGVIRGDSLSTRLTSGEALRVELPPGKRVNASPAPTVEVPGAEKPQPLSVAISDGESAQASQTLSYADTRRAGLYKLAWQVAPAASQGEWFAVNPDARESRLERISAEEIKGLFGGFEPEVISAATADETPLAVRGREIWRTLAIGLLGMLTMESCLATWTGRQR
jgi:hypothetical protein